MKTCTPLDAASLLRRVVAGDVEGATCALCLCEESLLPPTQAITLGSGRTITIKQLATELNIDWMLGDLTLKKVCATCVDKMISFFLFTKQCIRAAATIDKIIEVVDQKVSQACEQFFEAHLKDPQESYDGCSLKIDAQPDDLSRETVQIECCKCSLNFPTLRKLSLHQKEHIRSPYYLCRLCDQTFTGYHIFLSHWSMEHPEMPPPVLILQQGRPRVLDRYSGKYKPTEKAMCNICNTLFLNRLDFEEHACKLKKDVKEPVANGTNTPPHHTTHIIPLQVVKVLMEEPKLSRTHRNADEKVSSNMGLFACGKCPLNFPSIKELSLHLKVHGQGPYNKCTICDKMFTAYSGMLAHYKAEHPDEPVPVPMKHKKREKVTCDVCDIVLSSRRSLELHIFTKHFDGVEHTWCDICDKVYRNNENVTHDCQPSKRRSVHANSIIRKKYIKNTEATNDEFDESSPKRRKVTTRRVRKPRSDANQNVEELRNDAGVFECRKCYSDFETIEELSAHQKEHGKSPYHHCRVCDKTFNGFSGLVGHYTSVHPERPVPTPMVSQTLNHFNEQFSCDYCNASFKNASYLRYHVYRRHGQTTTEQVCGVCHVRYYQKHNCRFICTECPMYPCIHKNYLQAYLNAEEKEPRSRHRCIECDFMYRNRDDLLDHVNRCHLLILPQSCSDCGKKWPSKKALRKHVAISHPISKSLCDYCHVAVPKKHLEGHMADCKLQEKPFGCNLCGGWFPSEEFAEKHRKTHLPSGIVCDICCFQCESVAELKEHMLKCSGTSLRILSVKPVAYPCLKCPMDFTSMEESIAHEMSHPLETGYLCRGCNSIFDTKAERIECSRTHKEKVTEPCPVCGRLFNKLGLRVHMKMHASKEEMTAPPPSTGGNGELEKTHMCEVCGSMQATAFELKKHYDLHKSKWKCPHCQKLIQKRYIASHRATHEKGAKQVRRRLYCKMCSFTTCYRHVFEGHINRVHRRFKPYVCDICDKKFYSIVYLRSHQSTHIERSLECDECKMKFRSTKGFELHMMQHRGDLHYACELCDLKFVSASRKKEHQDRVHFGPQHKCSLCDKSFYRRASLRDHVLVVHEGGKRRRSAKASVLTLRKSSSPQQS